MRLNLCVSMLELGSLHKRGNEFFATLDGEEFWEPYDYITGFFLTWKWASLGTMPSRKTQLRSSLACAFAQRPSSWASRAHKFLVPVAGPAHRSDGCSHVGVLVLKEVGVLHFRRTTHSCIFILFLIVRLRWMDSSSISTSLACAGPASSLRHVLLHEHQSRTHLRGFGHAECTQRLRVARHEPVWLEAVHSLAPRLRTKRAATPSRSSNPRTMSVAWRACIRSTVAKRATESPCICP